MPRQVPISFVMRAVPSLVAKTRLHVRALWFLARAALIHRREDMPSLLRRLNATASRAPRRRPLDVAAASRAIGRVSRRLPWRSDCVVQALAAKFWLDGLGLPTEIRLAVANPREVTAHVWLLSEGRVVTGGPLDAEMTPLRPAAART